MGRNLNPPTPAVRDISSVVPTNKGGTGADNIIDAAINIGAIPKAKIGVAGGVATLNNFGRIPTSQLPASIVPDVTLSGSRSLYLNQVATFQISNYDANTAYTVSASAGTISRTGANITYTAPGVAGNYTITVNGRTVTVSVGVVRPTKPVVALSVSGAASAASATLTGSAFAMQTGSGTHTSSDWEIYADLTLTTVVNQSLNDSVNKTAYTFTGLGLSTTYFARVRYRDSNGNLSDWSNTVVIITKANYVPTLETTQIKSSQTFDSSSNGGLGFSVACSADGKRIVSGIRGLQRGLEVFDYANGIWTSTPIQLDNNGGTITSFTAGAIFVSMSADGTRLVCVVDGASDASSNYGWAWIYRNTGSGWVLETVFNISETNLFNCQMSADGTLVAFGCPNFNSGFGRVRVYKRTGTNWANVQNITETESTNSTLTNSGKAVAFSGDNTRLAIGVARGLSDASNNSGYIAVYKTTDGGSTWTLEQKIRNPVPTSGPYFGLSIKLNFDGSKLLTTEYVTSSGGNGGRGKIYYYTRTGSAWTLAQTINNGSITGMVSNQTGDNNNLAVNSDFTRFAVGGYDTPVNNGYQGSVFMFDFDTSTSTWGFKAAVVNTIPQQYKCYGYSVAFDQTGSQLFVGIPGYYSGVTGYNGRIAVLNAA